MVEKQLRVDVRVDRALRRLAAGPPLPQAGPTALVRLVRVHRPQRRRAQPPAAVGAVVVDVVAEDAAAVLQLARRTSPRRLDSGAGPWFRSAPGKPGTVGSGPQGLPLVKPPYGRITAYNLNSGDIAWQVANGETYDWIKNHPALKGVTIPKTGRADEGGIVVTKTLVFAGQGCGLFRSGSGGSGCSTPTTRRRAPSSIS